VTRQKFFRGPQVEKPWSRRLKTSGAAYKRLKANREENMTVSPYIQYIRKESRKNRKNNYEEDGDNQKEQDS